MTDLRRPGTTRGSPPRSGTAVPSRACSVTSLSGSTRAALTRRAAPSSQRPSTPCTCGTPKLAYASLTWRTSTDLREEASAFRQSRWFTRGWTLQELIAPWKVVFLSSDWHVLGSKAELAPVIEEITGIDQSILLHDAPLSSASVARRMSWASCRTTTRVEDEAYSLLGIFGLYMPTIYGEGRNAFRRLQEEIMKQIPDQTLYDWTFPPARVRARLSADREAHKTLHDRRAEQRLPSNDFAWVPNGPYFPLLAVSPYQFMFSADIHVMATAEFTVGNYGTRTRLPIHRLNHWGASYFLALLACEDSSGHAIALVLCPHPRLPDCFYITHSPQGSRYSIRTITLGMGRSLDPARNIANQGFWETRDICILKETYEPTCQQRNRALAKLSLVRVTVRVRPRIFNPDQPRSHSALQAHSTSMACQTPAPSGLAARCI
ncbi:hypothetical protein NUW54_g12801 [Trametes sanguinea]|uniref:Uncharacterized protein n=1 Tax=Trametes sanguinea TaxID=158606 RepID=A0ACC1MTH0_9APHY|nr:hypothetical protein NUW54_g12801 [Trametes sanguinea]